MSRSRVGHLILKALGENWSLALPASGCLRCPWLVVVQPLSRIRLCEPMDCNTPGFLVLQYLSPEVCSKSWGQLEQQTDLTKDCERKDIWGQTCPGTHFPPGFWDSPGKFPFGFLEIFNFCFNSSFKICLHTVIQKTL